MDGRETSTPCKSKQGDKRLSLGFRLLSVSILFLLISSTVQMACDPSCLTCSDNTPAGCLSCAAPSRLSGTGCCLLGTFFASSVRQCISCHPSCKECFGPSYNQCTQCNAVNSQITGDSRCACLPGFYDDLANYVQGREICQPCSSSCYTCSGPLATQCSSCPVNQFLEPASKTCKCIPGYFSPTPTPLSCQKCENKCVECSNYADSCTYCGVGATYVASDPITLRPSCKCPTSQYFDTLGNCITCHPSCLTCKGPKDSDCLTCDTTIPSTFRVLYEGQKCRCKDGYTPNSTTGKCDPCHTSCLICATSDAAGCLTCNLGRQPELATLPTKCPCAPKFYLVLATQQCQPCHPTCKTCSGPSSAECTACESGAELNSGSCRCASTRAYMLSGGTCESCHFSCLACMGPLASQCTGCSYNPSLPAPGTCQCTQGKYMDQNALCQPCHSSCLDCKGPADSDCLSCITVSPPLTLNSGGKCECPEKYMFDMSSTTCKACSDLHCLRCFPTTNKCIKCRQNAALTSSQFCLQLPGFTRDLTASTSSLPIFTGCDVTCSTCIDGRPEICITCKDPDAIKTETVCACPDGKFMTPGGACQNCGPRCKKCSASDSTCTSCQDGLVMNIIEGATICACQNANEYYDVASSVCKKCSPRCKFCQDTATKCTGCPPTMMLDTNTNTCICIEPLANYNPITNLCEVKPCPGLCRTCDLTTCSRCTSNSHLLTGMNCACNTGYYLDGNECSKCHFSCIDCRGPSSDQCITCLYDGSPTANGRCPINPIGKTYYWVSGRFELCHPNCETCSGPTEIECITCKQLVYGGITSSVSLENTGYCSIPKGFTQALTRARALIECHKSCNTCKGALATECTSCPPLLILTSSGTCVCKLGFSMNFVTGKCEPCHRSCFRCSAPNDPNKCVSCNSGISLAGTAPNTYCQPAPGYFINLAAEPYGVGYSCPTDSTSCLTITSGEPNNAKECKPNLTLDPLLNTCLNKNVGYWVDGSHALQQCQNTCLTCIGSNERFSCTSCTAGLGLVFLPNNGQCITPTLGSYWGEGAITPCATKCRTCWGYDFSRTNLCQSCLDNAYYRDMPLGYCVCKQGYNRYGADGPCYKCPGLCGNCDLELGACQACLNDNRMVLNAGACQCRGGYSVDAKGACVRAGTCDQSCVTCSAPNDPTACTSCELGMDLGGSPGRCYCTAGLAWDPEYYGCRACNYDCAPGGCPKSDYRVCTSCKEGLPKEVLINGQCICLTGYSRIGDSYKCEPCHSTCSTCSGRDYKSCLTCRDPFTTPINGICQCTDGTYFDNTYMSCSQCMSPCKTCLSRPYYCTSCNNGYTLYGNTCVCTNLAVCATQCHSSCRTCSGPNSNQCLSCKSSAVYLNNMCNCPYKSYMSLTGDCLPCADPNCVLCSPTGCAMCENGLTASNGVCVCPNPATEIPVNGYCTPKYTTQCTNPACLSCAADLTTCILLKSGNDLTAPAYPCGSALYRDSTGQCRACHEDCMECNGPYRNNCTYCKLGYPLDNGVCRGLIANTYYVLRNPVACHPTCASCEGAGPNLCRSCYGDSDLVNSACICKYGGWRDSSEKCTWNCHYTCQTCNGPNYNNCLSCKLPNSDRISNICFCQTPGYTVDIKSSTCVPCTPYCGKCSGTELYACAICRMDLYLMLQESVFVDLGR
jgi:hypothetical protein